MKQGTLVNRIVMVLLFVAILLYLGGAAWKGLRDPYPTVQAYAYAVEDTVEVTGYLARQEQVLTGSGGIVRLLPAEGEKVAAGAVVAQLYADQLSLERSDRLEILRAEVGELTAAIAAAGEPSQSDHTSDGVVAAMMTLRSSVEAGDFTKLENQSALFKSAVYQQAQRHGDAGELAAAVASANVEIAQLEAQTAPNVGRVAVERGGIFSGQADGYESLLTPESVKELTPSALRELDARQVEAPPLALGKLITDSTWYFVYPMEEKDARRFVKGDKLNVRFSRDWSGTVEMKVESIGDPEEDRVCVILSSNRFLSNTTLLRRQTVEIVFAQRTGLRVPTAAVRMEDGQSVVYIQVGVTAEKKPVNILAQGEDYTLVEPMLAQDASTKQQKLALRSGDAVIIAGGEIWDGMVLE